MTSYALHATETDCLLVIDVQPDFLPGGALAVPDGDAVIAPINALGRLFRHVVLTQDWHPAGHASFATSHPGKQPFETTVLAYGEQVLWPEHCIQGTPGAEVSPKLELPHAELIIRKGYRAGIDSYSAFREADRTTPTGLAGYLRERGFTRVFLCGVATDYCVGWSAVDAREAGFQAVVVEDACRAIDLDGSLERAWGDMAAAGVEREESGAIGG
ncbi:bifunctional nicotinamidase/pyrazinamidase [Methylobacterium sp. SyP6R]|uniref:bifunctional nicotinamidase/pyrazinamidase n=1 Tax=Methylobacterium sp. SyP6R TaxID=2718876 RepID=UPI001F4009C2|nr:bifunctional nicotinamidase/pyrazinamidase [Methylobacterium sp. SyP6R]MCF4124912.1 bifunctional nicotinamidase/pyrazinamidase [Methylobacterium sp. SyP6R]